MVLMILPPHHRMSLLNPFRENEQPSSGLIRRRIAAKRDLWGTIGKPIHNSRLPVFRIPPEVLEVIFLRPLETIRAVSPHGTAEPGQFSFLFVSPLVRGCGQHPKPVVLLGQQS